MTERDKMLDRLNDVHAFPGQYMFKVIGTNSDAFVSQVVQAAINVLGEQIDPDVSTRESSGGKHVSVTVSVQVEDAESVLDVYSALQELDEARFIL